LAKGLPASPGAAVGQVVFDADTAAEAKSGRLLHSLHEGVELTDKVEAGVVTPIGSKVILVRDETNPDDVHGMLASQAVLTARGGKTSHAAVVARGFGIPCVAGAEALDVRVHDLQFSVGNTVVKQGDVITLDGSTGAIYLGELPSSSRRSAAHSAS